MGLRRDSGNDTRKSVAQPASAIGLDANRAEIPVDPGAAIAQGKIKIGQAERFLAAGEQHFIKAAKAGSAIADRAVKARANQRDAADARQAEPGFNLHRDFCNGQIGPRRIADYHVADHLTARADGGDVIGGWQAHAFKLAGDIAVGDLFAGEPDRGKDRQNDAAKHQRHGPPPASGRQRIVFCFNGNLLGTGHRLTLAPKPCERQSG